MFDPDRAAAGRRLVAVVLPGLVLAGAGELAMWTIIFPRYPTMSPDQQTLAIVTIWVISILVVAFCVWVSIKVARLLRGSR